MKTLPDHIDDLLRYGVLRPGERVPLLDPPDDWRADHIEIARRNIANGVPDSRWCGDPACDLNGAEHGHFLSTRQYPFVPRSDWDRGDPPLPCGKKIRAIWSASRCRVFGRRGGYRTARMVAAVTKWSDLEVALATVGVFVVLGTLVMAGHKLFGGVS